MRRILHHVMIISLAICPIILGARLLILKDPLVERDEYVMFDITQTYMKSGRITSDIYGTFTPKALENTFIYPPVYFVILSSWLRLLGETVISQRMLSVTAAIVSLLVFYALVLSLSKKPVIAGLGTFLVALDTRFGEASRHGRMEIVVMLFILTAILAYVRSQSEKNSFNIWLAGLLGSVATMTHAMGFLAPAILVAGIALEKTSIKNKAARWIPVIIPSMAINLLWFIRIGDSWDFMARQMTYQAAQKLQSSSAIVTLFLRHPLYTMLFSLSIVILILLLSQALKKRASLYTPFSFVALGISAAFVFWGKEVWYVVYIVPFVALVTACLIDSLLPRMKSPTGILAACITILIISANVYALTLTAERLKDHKYNEISGAIAQKFENVRGVVCISASPDPSYILKDNAELTIREFIDVAGFIPQKKRFLDECDYALINIHPGDFAVSYFIRNGDKVQTVIYPAIPPMEIIKLKPLSARI